MIDPADLDSCPWEPIFGFRNGDEFRRLETWLAEQVAEGLALEEPTQANFLLIGQADDRWVRHLRSGQLWSITPPDWPARGGFEPSVSHLLHLLRHHLFISGGEDVDLKIANAYPIRRETEVKGWYGQSRAIYVELLKDPGGLSTLRLPEAKANARLSELRMKLAQEFHLTPTGVAAPEQPRTPMQRLSAALGRLFAK